MRDVTFCSSTDCPSKECKLKVLNNKFDPGEIISIADFSGECRFYVGWVLSQLEETKDFPPYLDYPLKRKYNNGKD